MTFPLDLATNRVAQDKLIDDAAAAVEHEFAQRGLGINDLQMFRLIEYLKKLVRTTVKTKEYSK